MTNHILKLFKRKKKQVILDAQGKIEAAESKVNEAFIMFQQAQDAIDESNAELLKASVEAERDIASIEANLKRKKDTKQKALDRIEANTKLSERLSDFLM